LRNLSGVPCHVCTRVFDLRARLADIQRGDRAERVPLLRQRMEFLARPERRLHDAQLFLVRGERQVRIRDLRDQRQLRAASRFLLREVLLQGRPAQVAHAPEQVEFELGDADTRSE
jgi:hypothetical protein